MAQWILLIVTTDMWQCIDSVHCEKKQVDPLTVCKSYGKQTGRQVGRQNMGGFQKF